MKKLLIFILLVSIIQITQAQENVILRSNGQIEKNGEVIKSADGKVIKPVSKNVNDRINKLISSSPNSKLPPDTLFNAFPQTGNSNFGFFGQDWLIQWFEAPTSMIIKAAGYNCNAIDNPGTGAELKLVKLTWTKDEILAANSAAKHLGYYEASGNGFNDISAFQDNPDVTGSWINKDSSSLSSPFAEDLWSNNGIGVPVTPVPSGEVNKWDFVQMNILGSEPLVLAGEIIGIAIKNTSTKMDDDRIGMLANNTLGIGGFKFYANGRLAAGGPGVGDAGWWSRRFTWDFALTAEFLYPGPTIKNITKVLWDVNSDPKEIYATITPTPFDTVKIQYSVNEDSFIDVEMTLDSTNGSEKTYKGIIPGQSPDKFIEYRIKAIKSNGHYITSALQTYGIYLPSNAILAIGHNYSQNRFSAITHFYNQYISSEWDLFSYNEVSAELLSNYSAVIEIGCENGFNYDHRDIIAEWLSQGSREYMLIGDEFLGYKAGWKDSTYIVGDFEYDVLGISQSHNDIHQNGGEGSSVVYPINNTILGDTLYNHLILNGIDTLLYDPNKTYTTHANNWLDGFEIRDDLTNAEIFMKGIGDNNLEYNIGINHEPNDDKIIFMSFDPLALQGIFNSNSDTLWVGNSTKTPFQTAYTSWYFDIQNITNIKDNVKLITAFSLEQNYPNPFNPETTIKFSIPVSENVTLKIYDVLGKEVKTLINDNLEAGSYTTSFNGNELASGIYIYRLTAGSFTSSKKMLLLK